MDLDPPAPGSAAMTPELGSVNLSTISAASPDVGGAATSEPETSASLDSRLTQRAHTTTADLSEEVVLHAILQYLENTPFTKAFHSLQQEVNSFDRGLREYDYTGARRHLSYADATSTVIGHGRTGYCLEVEPSAGIVITGADDSNIKVWRSADSRLLATLRGHKSELSDLSVDATGRYLASGDMAGVLRIWDLHKGVCIETHQPHRGAICGVHFSPNADSRLLVTAAKDSSITFWTYDEVADANTSVMFRAILSFSARLPTRSGVHYKCRCRPGSCECCLQFGCFSPGGNLFAAALTNAAVQIYRIHDERQHVELVHEDVAHDSTVEFVAFCPDATAVISGGNDAQVFLRRYQDGWCPRRLDTPFASGTKKVCMNWGAWTSDGRYAAAVFVNRALEPAVSHLLVWDSRTLERRHKIQAHTFEVTGLVCHPTQAHVLVSAGHDGRLVIWNVADGVKLAEMQVRHEFEGQLQPVDIMITQQNFICTPCHVRFASIRTPEGVILDDLAHVPVNVVAHRLVSRDTFPYPEELQDHSTVLSRLQPRQSTVLASQVARRLSSQRHASEAQLLQATKVTLRQPAEMTALTAHEGMGSSQPVENMGSAARPRLTAEERRQRREQRDQEFQNELQRDYERLDQQLDEQDEDYVESEHATSESDSDYSDWEAMEAMHRRSAQRATTSSRGRLLRRRHAYDDDSNSDEEDMEEQEEARGRRSASSAATAQSSRDAGARDRNSRKSKSMRAYRRGPIPLEDYLPSAWICSVTLDSPYLPQVHDQIVWIRQGHEEYLQAAQETGWFNTSATRPPWARRELRSLEMCTIENLGFESYPPAVAVARVRIEGGAGDGGRQDFFSFRWCDLEDIPDFVVLRGRYENAVATQWQPGHRFSATIDGEQWYGTVLEVSPSDPQRFPDSPWRCCVVRWDVDGTGEAWPDERLNPWEMTPLAPDDANFEPPPESLELAVDGDGESVRPLPALIRRMPTKDDNVAFHRDHQLEESTRSRVLAAVTTIRRSTVGWWHKVKIAYPIDLGMIEQRLANGFYRRAEAIMWDVELMTTNTIIFNQRTSAIVRAAEIIQTVLRRVVNGQVLGTCAFPLTRLGAHSLLTFRIAIGCLTEPDLLDVIHQCPEVQNPPFEAAELAHLQALVAEENEAASGAHPRVPSRDVSNTASPARRRPSSNAGPTASSGTARGRGRGGRRTSSGRGRVARRLSTSSAHVKAEARATDEPRGKAFHAATLSPSEEAAADTSAKTIRGARTHSDSWRQCCLTIHHKLCEVEVTEFLLDPVDPNVLEDYTDFVEQPICLREIEDNLVNKQYQTAEDYVRAIQHLLENAFCYNMFNPGLASHILSAFLLGPRHAFRFVSDLTAMEARFNELQREHLGTVLYQGGGERMTAALRADCQAILDVLQQQEDAAEFVMPLDEQAEWYPAYVEKIGQPLWLQAVAERLAAGEYRTLRSFANDAVRVFANALRFNEATTDFSCAAERLLGLLVQELERRTRFRVANTFVNPILQQASQVDAHGPFPVSDTVAMIRELIQMQRVATPHRGRGVAAAPVPEEMLPLQEVLRELETGQLRGWRALYTRVRSLVVLAWYRARGDEGVRQTLMKVHERFYDSFMTHLEDRLDQASAGASGSRRGRGRSARRGARGGSGRGRGRGRPARRRPQWGHSSDEDEDEEDDVEEEEDDDHYEEDDASEDDHESSFGSEDDADDDGAPARKRARRSRRTLRN
ncbi:uncharacterized protein MONBRDRAFT_4901 [Monosiga brevicollis MX1]|uniref:Bromo domain-containing protein n=1 Tax=Monosiga brevicollis TaxID=81824 RepID=A9UPA3_MONBE|nr:uncharacterized protein MONBRDRAFT_4901 [Monosiga brevicollis MX1]EDQ92840.1 predicted protein [Monosiga brevicollis MX1]|eukprot:XP_001742602.1 hypothetical protein [Monosiga brevicollis MX1]